MASKTNTNYICYFRIDGLQEGREGGFKVLKNFIFSSFLKKSLSTFTCVCEMSSEIQNYSEQK